MKTFKNKLFEALGAASMCWSKIPKGVFDDNKAVEIGDNLFNDYEKDLVSFGNYLLSDQRKKTIIHPEAEKLVGHHDLENWKVSVQNINSN